MGTQHFSRPANGGAKEDIRQQAQRTIALYEDVLDRAREVAHLTEVRVHQLVDDDGHDGAQFGGDAH